MTLEEDLDDVCDLVYGDRGVCALGAVTACQGLQRLALPFNSLTSLGGLGALTALQRLNVSHNRIASLAPLAHLAGLTHLDASHNAVTSTGSLVPCTGLQQLRLDHNGIAAAAQLVALTALQQLRCLALGGNPVMVKAGTEEDGRAATLAVLPELQVGSAQAANGGDKGSHKCMPSMQHTLTTAPPACRC